jgi:hypothetical protein
MSMRSDRAIRKREREQLPQMLKLLHRDLDTYRGKIEHYEGTIRLILSEIAKARRRMCELKMKDGEL